MILLDDATIRAWLTEVGRRLGQPEQLFLLGGAALALLGSSRPTLDLDYVGDDLQVNELQQLLLTVAGELNLMVEPVPIEHFVPVPVEANARHQWVGQFGRLAVYISVCKKGEPCATADCPAARPSPHFTH